MTRDDTSALKVARELLSRLDARDRYTAGHSVAVAVYGRDIAATLGLNDHEQQTAYLAGLLHDIGKIELSAELLERRGPLTAEEQRQMKQHPVIGEQILAKVDHFAEIARIVRHHHERIDGGGYPDGLAGDAIPLTSRIVAVAEAYNTMTSERPYADVMPSRVARMRLAQDAETQFDPRIIDAFESVLREAPEAYRTGCRQEFALPVY